MLFQKGDEKNVCEKVTAEEFIEKLSELSIQPVCSSQHGGGLAHPQMILVTSIVFLLTFLGQTHMAAKTQSILEKMETDALIDGLNVFTFGQLSREQIKEQLAYMLGDTDLTMEDTEIVQKLTIACAKGKQFQPNLLAVANYMTSNVLCDGSAKITSLKNTTAFSIGNMIVSSSTVAFMLCILLYYFTGDESYKTHANLMKTPPSKKGGKKSGKKGGKKSRKQSSRKSKKTITIKKRK